jgi:hypothetical protein
LSRHGANILFDPELMPASPFTVRCIETGKEVQACYAGSMSEGLEGAAIGIKFLDESVNLWNIGFPPLAESTKAVARLLLECVSCHSVEICYLNEIESLGFQLNGYLPRHCKHCSELKNWKRFESRVVQKQASPVRTGSAAPRNEISLPPPNRNIHTLQLRFPVCIRSRQDGEEVAETENVSRSGFSIRSRRRYAIGELVEVAVPYLYKNGSIFFPAQVNDIQAVSGQQTMRCSVSYIPAHQSWPVS